MENHKPETLVELLKHAVAASPDREALRFKQDKVWVGITAQRLLERVRNVALGLYSHGIRKGDRIAILAESGPLWSITDYAVLSNGAVNVPIYPTQTPHQVEYILRESEPKLLFVSTARQLRRVDEALKKFPNLRIVPFQPTAEGENLISFNSLEEEGARLSAEQPELYEAISSDVLASDLASVIYTSGTTGEPKGVLLTHSNVTYNALASGTFYK
jgi:Long-chain acyl-CoA synthetases (AMP-forming)